MIKLRSISVLLVISAFFAAGCGRNDSNPSTAKNDGAATGKSTAGQTATSDKNAPGAPSPASGRAVEITGNDAMKFSVTEIRSKPGEPLSVTLRNIGTMPKFSMGHNWVLLKKGVDPEKFAAAAANAPTTDYIPKTNEVLAHTKLLGPKETDTVTFNSPPEPGRYVFLCSFPGHYQVGMRGELIVE